MSVATPKWPSDRPSVRIAFVADFHAGGPHVGLAELDRVVARVEAARPDIVVLGGDYVVVGRANAAETGTTPEAIAQRLAPLGRIAPVVAVLGNHDWWLDGPRVQAALEAAGIPVLENAVRAVDLPGGRLWVAGLADDTTRRPDPAGVIGSIPEGEPVLAVAHDPTTFADVPGRAALTLAGHTHGGQVFVPWIGALITPGRAPKRWAYGHVREGGRDLYVTAGVGTSILPVRLNMPPEIAVVTLGPAEDERR